MCKQYEIFACFGRIPTTIDISDHTFYRYWNTNIYTRPKLLNSNITIFHSGLSQYVNSYNFVSVLGTHRFLIVVYAIFL